MTKNMLNINPAYLEPDSLDDIKRLVRITGWFVFDPCLLGRMLGFEM